MDSDGDGVVNEEDGVRPSRRRLPEGLSGW